MCGRLILLFKRMFLVPNGTIIKFFLFGCLGSILMWVLLIRYFVGGEGGKFLDYNTVPFDVFVTKYLPTGEVSGILK